MSDQITAWPTRRAALPTRPPARPAGIAVPPTWLTSSVLALASVAIIALACTSASASASASA